MKGKLKIPISQVKFKNPRSNFIDAINIKKEDKSTLMLKLDWLCFPNFFNSMSNLFMF
jgi:hypothetical protein